MCVNYMVIFPNSTKYVLTNVRLRPTMTHDFVLSASKDSSVKSWNLANSACNFTYKSDNCYIKAIEIIDDKTIIIGGCDGKIQVLDTNMNVLLKENKIFMQNDSGICQLKFLGCNLLASSDYDYKIKVWDLNNNRCLYELNGHFSWINGLAKINDNFLSSCSRDGTIRIWDLRTHQCVKIIDKANCEVDSIVFVEQNLLATGCKDGLIRLWNIETGELVGELIGHSSWVYCLLNDKPDKIISGSVDRTIKIWNWKLRTCLHTLFGHSDSILSLTLFKD